MRIPGTKYTLLTHVGGACLIDRAPAVKGEAPLPVAEVGIDGTIRPLSVLTAQDVKVILFRGMCHKPRDEPAGRWPIGLIRAVGMDSLPSGFLGEYLATRSQP